MHSTNLIVSYSGTVHRLGLPRIAGSNLLVRLETPAQHRHGTPNRSLRSPDVRAISGPILSEVGKRLKSIGTICSSRGSERITYFAYDEYSGVTPGESFSIKNYSKLLWYTAGDDTIHYLRDTDSSGYMDLTLRKDNIGDSDGVLPGADLRGGVDAYQPNSWSHDWYWIDGASESQDFEWATIDTSIGSTFSWPSEASPLKWDGDILKYAKPTTVESTFSAKLEYDEVGTGNDTIWIGSIFAGVHGHLENNGDTCGFTYLS